jgi:hypothetical protein
MPRFPNALLPSGASLDPPRQISAITGRPEASMEEEMMAREELGQDVGTLAAGAGQIAAEFAPGSGEMIDIQETLAHGRAAENALLEGDLSAALQHYLQGAVSSLGVVPVIGAGQSIARLARKTLPMYGFKPKTTEKLRNALMEIEPGETRELMTGPKGEKLRISVPKDMSKESRRIIQWYLDNPGAAAIHANRKTSLSIDFCTNCPKRADITMGPCPYCYVEHARTGEELFNIRGGAKKVGDYPYDGDILNWPTDMIRSFNKDGGLRMFSFGDFRPGLDEENVARVLEDASRRGLYIKAITKQPEFVQQFGDHPNLRINISIDNVPDEISVNAPPIEEALRLKGNRDNIAIRAVALNTEEAIRYAEDDRVDLVTLYNGVTNFDSKTGKRNDKLLRIVAKQNPQMVERVGEDNLRAYLDTWEAFKPESKKHVDMEKMFPGKICCEGGKCSRDSTKCGFGAMGALLIGGVFLPDDENVDGD